MAQSSASVARQRFVRVSRWNANRFVRSYKIASGSTGGRSFKITLLHRQRFAKKIRKPVGSVERSETHRFQPQRCMMGFASLYPSYELRTSRILSVLCRSISAERALMRRASLTSSLIAPVIGRESLPCRSFWYDLHVFERPGEGIMSHSLSACDSPEL